jgi:hypothetical protein
MIGVMHEDLKRGTNGRLIGGSLEVMHGKIGIENRLKNMYNGSEGVWKNRGCLKVIPDEWKFSGDTQRAMPFLQQLKEATEEIASEWVEMRLEIRRWLSGNAYSWYEGVCSELRGYEDFERQFKRRYWNELIKAS